MVIKRLVISWPVKKHGPNCDPEEKHQNKRNLAIFGEIFTRRLSKIYDEFERISLYCKLNIVTRMIKLFKILLLYSVCVLYEIRLILYFGL